MKTIYTNFEESIMDGFKGMAEAIVNEEVEKAKKNVEDRILNQASKHIPELLASVDIKTTDKMLTIRFRENI